MKTIFCTILPFLICIQISQCTFVGKSKEEKNEDVFAVKDSTKLSFNIIPEEVKSYKGYGKKEFEIVAEIRHTNFNKKDLQNG